MRFSLFDWLFLLKLFIVILVEATNNHSSLRQETYNNNNDDNNNHDEHRDKAVSYLGKCPNENDSETIEDCVNSKPPLIGNFDIGPYTIMSPFGTERKPIEQINGIPAAFGDFDHDHLVDVFLITGGGHRIQALQGQSCVDGKTLLTYFGSRNCLSRWPQIDCHFPNHTIVNLALSDFTGSNHLDWLVTLRANDDSLGRYKIILVHGAAVISNKFDCSKQEILLENTSVQPFVIDYNGDMISDFITSTNDCPLLLWLGGSGTTRPTDDQRAPINTTISTTFSSVMSFDDTTTTKTLPQPITELICLKHFTEKFMSLTKMEKMFQFAKPHSSAFVNLNSFATDMTPDLFIDPAGDYGLYVYNTPSMGFNVFSTFRYPEQKIRGQSAFMDVNYDGIMDHLIPVCLNPFANSFRECDQIGLLAFNSSTSSWFNLLDSEWETGINTENRTFTFAEIDLFSLDSSLSASSALNIPVTLRVGDLDYDGYPDFVATLEDVNDGRKFAAIFLNVNDSRNDTKNYLGRRFKLSWLSDTPENVALTMLFDLYNNGRLVLLYTTIATTGVNRTPLFHTELFDYYMDKSFYYAFLRVSVISGRCSDKPITDADRCPIDEKVALGTNPHGAMACFEGAYSGQKSCSVQLAQSVHFSLQLPYMVFGLGDVLNVVTDLKIAIANGADREKSHTWNEVIPGSNLVIVPYPVDDFDRWSQRVYINMSIYSMVSLAFLCALGLLLTIAIYILHCRERKEDHKDHIEYKKHWL